MSKTINSVLLCSVLVVSYFLAAQLGFQLAFEQANTSPVWPPTGVAIGATLYFGYRAWPGIFIGALLANITTSVPMLTAAGIATGNTLEAIFACYLIKRLANDNPFETIINVILFCTAVTVATTISATLGVGSLVLSKLAEPSQFAVLWSTWWIGDTVGGLLITPLLLTWLRDPGWRPRRVVELLSLFAILLICSAVVFSDLLFSSNNYPLAFIFLPIMFWAALRFGLKGVAGLITLLSVVAIYGTSNGFGPFVRASTNESLLLLQGFIATVVLASMIMAASREERRRADSELRNAQIDLEQRVTTRTLALARSNESLLAEVAQRESTTEALKNLLTATSMLSHDEFLRTSVKSVAAIYNTHYAFYGVFTDDSKTRIKSLAVWANNNYADNFEYELKGSPCQDVLDCKIALVPDHAVQLYPDDKLLQEMAVESYYGAPLLAPDKTMLGIVAVMHTEPMELQEWVKPVLGILANRFALELRRKAADAEIRLAENVFNDTVEAIMISEVDGRILRVNPAFSDITGYSFEEAVGNSPDLINSERHDQQFYTELRQAFLHDGYWQGEIWHQRRDGSVFPAWQTVSMVPNGSGAPAQLISIFSDISEKKKSEEQIYQLAHYDPLTRLPNRTSFRDHLEKSLLAAKRHDYRLALIFFDIDNFKLINDTSGHQAGDELLTQVATRLNSIVRNDDTVSRLGGDEFTVLLNDIESSNDAMVVAKKILTGLAEPMRLTHGEIYITVSIGISTFPIDGSDADTLLKHADAAMYRAKEQGRNNFQFFTAKMHARAIERLELEKAMRLAIENDELVLYYQPQVDVFSGEITSCEALVRWQHPDKGLIPPDRFISIAEENGLIVAVGKWVMNAACQQYKRWSQQGIAPKYIAINVSARQLRGQNLVTMIKQALDTSGVDPGHIELELTETMFMDHIEETNEILQELRSLGIQLSVDDFGTGYSSMAYLKRFPINKLKIDRSFVNDLATNPDDAAIVSATIAMGHSLNLSVTAEGVETDRQLEFLQEHGCDEVQGYYFSRPLAGEEMAKLLAAGSIVPDPKLTVAANPGGEIEVN